MNKYGVGTELKIEDKNYKVIGYIVYKNPADGCSWIDYRLKSGGREFWLSVDEHYGEYTLSWPANSGGNIGPEWKKVDEGDQVVTDYSGSVDVDSGERAGFVEYEDETEEKTLSMEIWEDGTEVSQGYYLDKEEIQVIKKATASSSKRKGLFVYMLLLFIVTSAFTFPEWLPLLSELGGGSKTKITDYLKESTFHFQYLTSMTGRNHQNAQVYKAMMKTDTESVTKLIIEGIEGETEQIAQNSEDTSDTSVTISTADEYAIVYKPEEEPDRVYVQVSSREYTFGTDQAPYKAGPSASSWYRSHYYSSSYQTDVQRFKDIPSSYSMYNGPIVHDLGNGYFDSYASNIRQSSVRSRNSSGGGTGFGK